MRRITPLTFALAVLLVGPAARADEKDDAIKKEMKLNAGTWEVVKVVEDGKEIEPPKDMRPRAVVKEDGSYTVKLGDMPLETGTAKIGDLARSPREMDVTAADGPNKGKTLLAIYELKGDDLRVCMAAEPGKPRPTDFTAKEGSGRVLLTYKRVK